jgi:hypothetical protein
MVAFEDPLLLGGQAARAGISCASCHNSARGNPAFVFPGISGEAGTADVTSSLFSSHRGDGEFNPKRIPDLTFDEPKISRVEPGILEAFIRGLIVDEFDGEVPPKRVLDGLAAYIRSTNAKACPPSEPLTVTFDLSRYGAALLTAKAALDQADQSTALAMIRAARSRLGIMAERFSGNDLEASRSSLIEADEALAILQRLLRDGDESSAVNRSLQARLTNIDRWATPIKREASASLYNPERLAAALNATRTP